MISFEKLMDMLKEKGMSKTEFRELIGFYSGTMNNLSKNRPVTTETIDRICSFFECQPSDIMEYVSEDDIETRRKSAIKREIKLLEHRIAQNQIKIEELEREL